MTPNRNWFKSYAPSSVPIRVANGQVVFSAGVGTVKLSEGVEAQTRRGGAKPIEIGGPEPTYIHVHYKEGN